MNERQRHNEIVVRLPGGQKTNRAILDRLMGFCWGRREQKRAEESAPAYGLSRTLGELVERL